MELNLRKKYFDRWLLKETSEIKAHSFSISGKGIGSQVSWRSLGWQLQLLQTANVDWVRISNQIQKARDKERQLWYLMGSRAGWRVAQENRALLTILHTVESSLLSCTFKYTKCPLHSLYFSKNHMKNSFWDRIILVLTSLVKVWSGLQLIGCQESLNGLWDFARSFPQLLQSEQDFPHLHPSSFF